MNITELINKELSKSSEADPYKIALKLVNVINNDQIQELIIRGMKELIREQIRFDRMSGSDAALNRVGPSRRSIAIQERVSVEDHWKMIVDCNINDLMILSDDYKNRANQMQEKAQYYDLLAEELKDSGYATVGEMWREQESKMVA